MANDVVIQIYLRGYMRNLGVAATASHETFRRLFMDVQGGSNRLLDCSYGLWDTERWRSLCHIVPKITQLGAPMPVTIVTGYSATSVCNSYMIRSQRAFFPFFLENSEDIPLLDS